MKTKELYEKDNKTLEKLIADTKAQIVKDRFKIASKEMTKVSEIAKSRKLVARIMTILHQREIIEKEKTLEKKVPATVVPESRPKTSGKDGDKK